MATFIKKITVGTPIRKVTSGAFNINNIDGVTITGGPQGNGDSGDLLVYSAALDTYLNTNTLTDFRVGQISFKGDSVAVAGNNPLIFSETPELKNADNIFDSADVTSKAYVDREVEKVKHTIFKTDDNFIDSVNTYADETIKVLGGNGITTKARKLGSEYNLTIDLDSTNAVDGTYGSATQIPIIKINDLGLVDSVGTTAVAGVTSFSYDSTSGLLSINTADGNTFSDSINLSPFTTATLTEATVGTQQPAPTQSYSITLTNSGSGAYVLNGNDRNGVVSGNNQPVTIRVDDTITFNNTVSGVHPMYIKDVQGDGLGNQTAGVTGGGTATVTWTPTSTGTYYYQCAQHNAMNGTITVVARPTVTGDPNLYYTRARFDSALGDNTSISTVRGFISVSGDLQYDPSTGVISVDVEQVYTKDDFDSDLDAAISSSNNIAFDSVSNSFDLTETGVDSGTYGSASLVPIFTVDKYGRLDSITTISVAGVSNVVFDSASGVFTINTADGGTFPKAVYSQQLTRTALVEGTGVHYDSVTGVISIGQPVETTSDVTFGKVTTDSVIAGGPVSITGDVDINGQVELTGNFIPGADSTYDLGSTTRKWRDLHLSGSSLFLGSLIMRDSDGNMAIHGPNKGAVEVTASRGVFDSASISQLTVDSLNVGQMDLDSVRMAQLNVTTGDIRTFTANTINADSSHITNFSADILNADSVSVGFVKFDQVAYDDNIKPSTVEGAVYYNSGPDALVYKPSSASPVKIGQDDVTRVYNNTGAMIPKGAPVYVTGTANNFPTIAKAKADAIGTIAETIGVLKDSINNASFGLAISRGIVGRLDTTAFSQGSNVFVSADSEGKFTTTAPAFPNFAYKIGTVLVSDSVNGSGTGGTLQIDPFREFFEQIRVTGSGRIDQDFTIGGNLTVIGSQVQTSVQSLAVSDTVIELGAGDTIGLAATNYNGTGNNDGIFTGHYTGDNVVNYHVRIDSVGEGGEGDKIQWSFNSNYSPLEPFDSALGPTSFVLSSGDKVAGLANGVSISFTGETGHDLNDSWNGEASPINVQIGIVGNYNPPADSHAFSGIIRDPSDNRWKFFQQYLPDPQANINFGHASLEYAPVQVGTLFATTVNADLSGDVTGTVSDISNHSTSTLAEGTNRYFTDDRVDSSIKDSIATDNLHVATGYIGQFSADSTVTTSLNVSTGTINTFISVDASIDSAHVGQLSSDSAHFTQLNATTGDVETLTSDSAIITDISGATLNYNTIVRSGATDHSGTYGSASLIPIIKVDASGFIDSIGTTTVAGVTGFTFDSNVSSTATITTADGGSFSTMINKFDSVEIGDADNYIHLYNGNITTVGGGASLTVTGKGHLNLKSGSGTALWTDDSVIVNALANNVNITKSVSMQDTLTVADSARFSTKLTANKGVFGTFANTAFPDPNDRPLILIDSNATMNIHRIHPLYDASVEFKVSDSINAPLDTYWDIFAQKSDASFNFRDRNLAGAPTRLKFKSTGEVEYPVNDSATGSYTLAHNTVNRTYQNTGAAQSGLKDSSNDPIINLYVRTDFKTSNHRYFGTGSAKGYYISYDSDGLRTSREMQSPHLDLIAGRTYRFHHHDSSMATHAIRFYYDNEKNGLMNSDSAAFIEYKGTAGDKNVGNTYSQIRIKDNGPTSFAYQCINHPYMGNSVTTNSTGGSRIIGSSSGIKVDGTIEGTIDGGTY